MLDKLVRSGEVCLVGTLLRLGLSLRAVSRGRYDARIYTNDIGQTRNA